MIRRFAALLLVLSSLVTVFIYQPALDLMAGKPVKASEIAVAAQDLQLVCPGPIFKSQRNNVSRFSQEGLARLLASLSQPKQTEATVQVFGKEQTELQQNLSELRAERGAALKAAGTTNLAGSALLSGSQFQRLETDWAGGLLATSCQRPSNDLWLVGGDTRTGREALLLLSNPSNVDATVEITIVSSNGPISAPGLTGVSVPKAQTTVIPLNGIVPSTATLAIRVQSKGGALGAWIQQRAVRGTKAAGIDLISPVAPAATELVIPGFFVRGTKDAQTLQAGSDAFSDITNIVRVVNPTDREATVLVKVVGVTAQTFGTVIQQKVAANSVADLEVNGIEDGDYAIFVSSDQKVLASAKLNRTSLSSNPNTDFTWLTSITGFNGEQHLAVPSPGISKLAVANPGKEPISISYVNGPSNGTLQLAAGAAATVTLSSGNLVLKSDSVASATVVFDLRGSVANFAMVEYRNLGGLISVLVQ